MNTKTMKSKISLVSLDLALLLLLTSCQSNPVSELINSVVDAFSVDAVAIAERLEPGYQSPSTNAYNMVGSENLTEHQMLRLLYLHWPQSYKAMSSLLGAPTARDTSTNRDYYTMPNGNDLFIQYNAQGYAIDYRLGDSN
ncbi:hypothetical protein [Leptothoe spongobia]|uniref:FAS1 domain-containing protein n=1 Tax=Leptothoe spongobia TAU-MAC 1115 TaxID=1967444 RepID=A0A947DIJ1_9CYAN|nr:hypothetical protein [Leptothoe spongobia]MBT9317686.1 hypothetical protein [Leptothoe spongobia TAU-MAC 1115]